MAVGKVLLAAALCGSLLLGVGTNAYAVGKQRSWTLADIVDAPKVIETAISSNGTTAYYIVRRDVLATNSRQSVLYKVDISKRLVTKVLTSPWISRLSQVPGSEDWTLLADVGGSVQLYRLNPATSLKPFVTSRSTVIIGAESRDAIAEMSEPDQAFGVFDYGWSPDGRALWYSTAKRIPRSGKRVETTEQPRVSILNYPPNQSELHVVDERGGDRLIASAVGQSDPLPYIIYYAGAARWEIGKDGLTLDYSVLQGETSGTPQLQAVRKNWKTGEITNLVGQEPPPTIRGPNGGALSMGGAWPYSHLTETLPTKRVVDFGETTYAFNPYTANEAWTFQKDGTLVLALRSHGLNVRSGLLKLHQSGGAKDLEPNLSLTNCSFSQAAEVGICVRQGINAPPSVVSVNVPDWSITKLIDVDPSYNTISPLQVEGAVWQVGDVRSDGFIVYPRGFKAGHQYPAIILTHGGDAANTFVNQDFQWSYPAQVWAENGYVVIYINDIPVVSSAERLEAYSQWAGLPGKLSGKECVELIWLDQLKIYRKALKDLEERGVLDPARVGIAGFSRGSQMVSLAMTQSDMFKAGSMGDGGYFSPSSYWMSDNSIAYNLFFGGYPNTESTLRNWQTVAPVFRAKEAHGAVLFQNAKYNFGKLDFYYALRDAHVPAETVLFKDETHGLHLPQSRLIAMQQNLDWFDFWLSGTVDHKQDKNDQYARWNAMLKEYSNRMTVEPSANFSPHQ